MSTLPVKQREAAILDALNNAGSFYGIGPVYLNFRTIAHNSGIGDIKLVRRDVRRLSRKGLAEFARGLCTEDGDFAGSGYAITEAGRALLTIKEPTDV